MRRLRYLLSLLIPVPMRSVYAAEIHEIDVQEHRDSGWANHFRDDDHHDLVSIRWWQWRGRCMAQRTISTCIGA